MKDVNKFWEQVDILTEDECWLWHGYSERDRGVLRWDGVKIQAHRLAYQLFTGDPKHHLVRHTCFNSLCCNPKHLVLGSHKDNNRDFDVTNLTARDIRLIRDLARLHVPYWILAGVFLTSRNNISHIVRGVIWT